MRRHWRGWVLWLGLAVAGASHAVGKVESAWGYGAAANSASASDSLPLYLGAKAMHQGLDPTAQESLQTVYKSSDVRVTKALFSVLYPPSMHLLLQPLAGLSHKGFLHYWRQILMLLTLLGLAGAGLVGVRGRRRPLAVMIGVGGGLTVFPFFLESQLALGQANLAIAGCFGIAMGLASLGGLRTVGAVAALGTAAKLVPAIMFWPLLWGLRIRALVTGAVVGLVLLGFTMTGVPLGRMVTNVLDTLAFQGAVEPHWLHDPSLPDWGRFVGILKRPALTLLSLVLVAWSQWSHRHLPGRARESLSVGIALLAVALGADGAGAAAPYATLAMPGAAMLLTWPFAERASRLSWLGAACGCAVVALLPGGLEAPIHDTEVRLVAGCTLIWLGVAVRLVTLTRPWSGRAAGGGLALVVLALVYTSIYTWRPPYGGPKTLPDAAPGSMTTPAAPPVAPVPH